MGHRSKVGYKSQIVIKNSICCGEFAHNNLPAWIKSTLLCGKNNEFTRMKN